MILGCMTASVFASNLSGVSGEASELGVPSSFVKIHPLSEAPKMENTKSIGPVTFSNFLKYTEYPNSKEYNGQPIKIQSVILSMGGCAASNNSKSEFVYQIAGFNQPNANTYWYQTGTGMPYKSASDYPNVGFETLDVKAHVGKKIGNNVYDKQIWEFIDNSELLIGKEEGLGYWMGYSFKAYDDNGQAWYYVVAVTDDLSFKDDSETTTPVTPVPSNPKPNLPKETTANRATSNIYVNGKKIKLDAQEINGSTYFKLRDIAYVLNGTEKQFAVGWDNASKTISLTTNQPYEGKVPTFFPDYYYYGIGPNAELTDSPILVDGVQKELYAYNITGSNFFKLRDLGQTFDFYVGWDSATKSVTIDTTKGYQ